MNSSLKLFIAGTALALLGTVEGHSYHCDVPDEWFVSSNVTNRNMWNGRKWPNGIVKYELHSSLTQNDRREVQSAFDDISSKTCIRFQTRSNGERAYTSIERDDSVCGLGHLCMTGGYQFAKFGGRCANKDVMVHELGHNLCMHHEQQRKDRDDYLEFRNCNQNQIPEKIDNADLRGSLYDYGSRMHYSCGWCPGGWPRARGGDSGLCRSRSGLSVLDADKINDFYDCRSCYAHRWRPIESLTDEERGRMWQLGRTLGGDPLYVCRGLVDGEIAIGKYHRSGVCFLPFGGREHQLRNRAEVFLRPTNSGEANQYRLIHKNDRRRGKAVEAGRSWNGHTFFIAVGSVEREGRREELIGKVFEGDMSRAYFPFARNEIQLTDFSYVTCG